MTVSSQSNVPSLWHWPLTYEGNLCCCSELSILYTFHIDISSNSREIKYQNSGRTHRHTDIHTDRRTDRVKTIPRNPLRGEVIIWLVHLRAIICDIMWHFSCLSRRQVTAKWTDRRSHTPGMADKGQVFLTMSVQKSDTQLSRCNRL